MFILTACGGGNEGGGDPLLPETPTLQVACEPDAPVPPGQSLTVQCGSVNGSVLTVDIVATDTPAAEPVVSAVMDLDLSSRSGSLGLQLRSCTPGPALGSSGELLVDCTVPSGSPHELLAVVSRQGLGPGVTVTGSQTVLSLQFDVVGLGTAGVVFVKPNDPTGSALLRRNPSDPTDLQTIGGIAFAGGEVSGS
jgi:hypothetical protein